MNIYSFRNESLKTIDIKQALNKNSVTSVVDDVELVIFSTGSS